MVIQQKTVRLTSLQSLLISKPDFDNEILKKKTYEQCIAELAVRQAMYMLDQFKIEGIDK